VVAVAAVVAVVVVLAVGRVALQPAGRWAVALAAVDQVAVIGVDQAAVAAILTAVATLPATVATAVATLPATVATAVATLPATVATAVAALPATVATAVAALLAAKHAEVTEVERRLVALALAINETHAVHAEVPIVVIMAAVVFVLRVGAGQHLTPRVVPTCRSCPDQDANPRKFRISHHGRARRHSCACSVPCWRMRGINTGLEGGLTAINCRRSTGTALHWHCAGSTQETRVLQR